METTIEKPKKQSLFQLLTEFEEYENLLAEHGQANDGEILPEVAPILEEWENEFLTKLMDKVDRTVDFIRFAESQETFFKQERDIMSKKAKSFENLVTKVKRFIKSTMEYKGTNLLQGDKRKITLVNSGGVTPLIVYEHVQVRMKNLNVDALDQEFASTLPPEFVKTVHVLNKEAIREQLEEGKTLSIATLGERGKHIRLN
jgi:hypothetical protein